MSAGASNERADSPLDRPLVITFFPNFGAAEKREEILSLRSVAPRIRTTTGLVKEKLPWLKLARFGGKRSAKGSLRNNENLLAISGIEGDYDAEISSVDDALRVIRAAGIAGMVYTSPSHTEDAPRWRVLCPLSEERPPGDRHQLLARLNGLFQGALSGESFTLSQSYYFGSIKNNPSHRVEIVDGAYLDARPDLDADAIGKPKSEYTPVQAPSADRTQNKSKFIEAVIDNALSKVRGASDGHKHNILRAQARLLGGYQHAGSYSITEAAEWLVAALPASIKDRKAALVTALWGLERGAEQPIVIEDRNVVYLPTQGLPPDDDPGYWQSASFDEPVPQGPAPYPEDENVIPRVFDPWNTLRPVSFPIEVIPANLRGFILERARIIGADPAAIFWACLSACSAAIDGRIRLQMKRHDKWSVPPAIWVALIGLPSTKKTPIVDTAWKPLQALQARDMGAHQIALAQWKSAPKEERARIPEPPGARRLVSHDATMEALQEILSKQDRGIGVLRDELAGWIGSMEKYAPGKGGAADRAFALQSYNGGSHVVDRVMRGTLPINNLLAVICGGIQPDRLRQFGDLTDDGLWQRFIGIIVAPATMGEDEESRGEGVYAEIIEKLLSVHPSTRLTLCDEAHTIREDVQKRIYAMEQSEVLGARFVGFVGKLTGLWGRLTMVLHLISEPSSQIIRPEIAAAARTLLFRSVLPNAARIYTAMGGAGADVEATQSIAGYILTKGLRRIVMSDLTRNVRVCRHKTQEDVRRLLSPLEAGGWLMPEKDFAPMSWLVADQVHTQFEAQARKEAVRRDAVRALITGHGMEDEE